MKVAILGAGGQLGHILTEYLSKYIEVIPVKHDKLHVDAKTSYKDYAECLDYLLQDIDRNLPGSDRPFEPANKRGYVVNCIGATKPHFNDKSKLADNIYVNAVWPHILSEYCRTRQLKLIHITTDCVYSGSDDNVPAGMYTENSPKNGTDDYGQSKSLGEPEDCMVLRTSIIGTEKGASRFLISWVLGQSGKEVNGFINHTWSGLTTLELSKRIFYIINANLWSNGTYHLFGPDITKDELVREIAAAFKVDVQVKSVKTDKKCDRTLRTVKDLNKLFAIKSHQTMLLELKEWSDAHA